MIMASKLVFSRQKMEFFYKKLRSRFYLWYDLSDVNNRNIIMKDTQDSISKEISLRIGKYYNYYAMFEQNHVRLLFFYFRQGNMKSSSNNKFKILLYCTDYELILKTVLHAWRVCMCTGRFACELKIRICSYQNRRQTSLLVKHIGQNVSRRVDASWKIYLFNRLLPVVFR